MKTIDRFMRLFKVICLVWLVLNLLVTVGALAQDVPATSAQPATWVDALLAVAKAVAPSVLAFLSAYVTKAISWALSMTPTPWLGLVSTIVGSLGAAMTAAAEGLSVEAVQANAVVGAGSGAMGHMVLQSKPLKPEAAARPASPPAPAG